MAYPIVHTDSTGTAVVTPTGTGLKVRDGGISLDDSTPVAGRLSGISTIVLPTNLRTGVIPLDINTARVLAAGAVQATTEGGVPDSNTAPSLNRVNGATDKALRLAWAAASTVEIQFAPFVYPPDLDDTAAVEVHFLAAMAGATDVPVLTVAYFEGLGDTDAGGNTAAVTGTTIAEYTRTIAAADVGPHPTFATVGVTPAAHGTDILYIYAAWVEYTRKTS